LKENPVQHSNYTNSSLRITEVLILLLIVAGTLVYSNALHASFFFDDINFITKNDPNVHMTQFSWCALKKAALGGHPHPILLVHVVFCFL